MFIQRSQTPAGILAILSAGVSRRRNGFRKDKSGENCKSLKIIKDNSILSKLAESEEDLLEHRTDGTDAFNTLYIGANKIPYHNTFSLSISGFQ